MWRRRRITRAKRRRGRWYCKCGAPLPALPALGDVIECPRCGRTWTFGYVKARRKDVYGEES